MRLRMRKPLLFLLRGALQLPGHPIRPIRALIRIRTRAGVREETVAVARRRRRELLAGCLVCGGGRGVARDVDSDVVGEGTVVVDGSRKVIGDGRIAVDEEAEVVGAGHEVDPGGPLLSGIAERDRVSRKQGEGHG